LDALKNGFDHKSKTHFLRSAAVGSNGEEGRKKRKGVRIQKGIGLKIEEYAA
jgi:hypothetical protein